MPPDSQSLLRTNCCPVCEGKGMVLAHMAITSPVPRPDFLKCPACEGTGNPEDSRVEVVPRAVAEQLARAVSASLKHGEISPLADALKAYLAEYPWSDL